MNLDSDQRIILGNRRLETSLTSAVSCEGESGEKDISPWVFGICVVGGAAVIEGCYLIHQYSHVIKPIINSISNYIGLR